MKNIKRDGNVEAKENDSAIQYFSLQFTFLNKVIIKVMNDYVYLCYELFIYLFSIKNTKFHNYLIFIFNIIQKYNCV